MKTTLRLAACIALLVGPGNIHAQEAAKTAPATRPLDSIAWLAGGTWTAELKDEHGEPTRIENRIRWSSHGQLIQFATTFISHNKPEIHYEGIYAWDPVTKQIRFWYADKEGNLTEGTAHMDGQTLTQDFTIKQTDGKPSLLRSLIVRDSADSYNWSVMSKQDGEWKELFHLRYVREK
jgi:hypothetical protein